MQCTSCALGRMNVRLPVYKLKLVRSGWANYPPISLKEPQLAALFFHRLIGQADREHAAALFLGEKFSRRP